MARRFRDATGQNWIIMTINQSGARLSGHHRRVRDYEINGRVVPDPVRWLVGRRRRQVLEITMKGKLKRRP